MLMKGLAGIDNETRHEAMLVLGRRVFGSQILSGHEKSRAFPLTARKILALYHEDPGDGLTFYYRAAMLGRLYRFITEQSLDPEGFSFEPPRPIAFFPGTFDPFTLSHKASCAPSRDLGSRCCRHRRFSWSKRTQPYRIRRRIAAMSVADEFYVHIFPEDSR